MPKIELGGQLRIWIREQVWLYARYQLSAHFIENQDWHLVWDQVGDCVWERVSEQVEGPVRECIRDRICEQN